MNLKKLDEINHAKEAFDEAAEVYAKLQKLRAPNLLTHLRLGSRAAFSSFPDARAARDSLQIDLSPEEKVTLCDALEEILKGRCVATATALGALGVELEEVA